MLVILSDMDCVYDQIGQAEIEYCLIGKCHNLYDVRKTVTSYVLNEDGSCYIGEMTDTWLELTYWEVSELFANGQPFLGIFDGEYVDPKEVAINA